MQNVNKKLNELKQQFSGEEIEAALRQSNLYDDFTKSSAVGKLRLLSSLAKTGGALSGSADISGAGLIAGQILKRDGVKTNTKNSESAYLRGKTYDGSLKDTTSSVINMTSGVKNSVTGLAATGLATGLVNPATFASLTSPSIALAHATGGVGALGGTLGSLAGLSLGGVPAMALGLAGLYGAGKGTKALSNWAGKGTAGKNSQLSTLVTGPTSSQLENTYGSTSQIQSKIKMFPTPNSRTDHILAMIEGHTSVIPLIAELQQKNGSHKDKAGANKAHNILEEEYTSDGTMFISDKSIKQQTILAKLLSGLEVGATNLPGIFDLKAQFENFIKFKSTTALYDEVNSKSRLDDPLLPEKQFGAKFGVSVGMVQAIHTTPSQIMMKADTYESKHLALLGLLTEINRFQAHELLRIRTDGFGIMNASSAGYLGDMREDQFLKQQQDISAYEAYGGKALVDNTIGRIPILAGAVNAIKGISAITPFMMDTFRGEIEKEKDGSLKRDEKGKVVRKKPRSIRETLKDLIVGDIGNVDLKNEEKLRKKIGAVELGPEKLMAHYLGEAYPSRFELLLEYNLSQKESLEALVGPIKRTKAPKLSMNKYDGVFGNNKYHKAKASKIKDLLNSELGLMNKSGNIFSEYFGNVFENDSKFLKRQEKNARKENPFLDEILGGKKQKNAKNNLSKGLINSMHNAPIYQTSVEGIQRAKKLENREELKIRLLKKQTDALLDIRDCLNCKSRRRLRRSSSGSNSSTDAGNNFDWFGLPDLPDRDKKHKTPKKHKKHKTPKNKSWMGKAIGWIKDTKSFKTLSGSKALNVIKSGLSILTAEEMMAGGALGVSMSEFIIPALVVAGAGYLAFEAGEGIYNLMNDDSSDDSSSGLTSFQKTRQRNAVDGISRTLGQRNVSISEITNKYLKHRNKNELLYIIQEYQNSRSADERMISDAAVIRLQQLNKSITYINAEKKNFLSLYDGSHYVDYSHFSDNSFNKSAIKEMRHMSSDQLMKLYKNEHDHFSEPMLANFGNILNKSYLREDSHATGIKQAPLSTLPSLKQHDSSLSATSAFGMRHGFELDNGKWHKGRMHNGIDFSTGKKSIKVYALSAGTLFHQRQVNKETGQLDGGGIIAVIVDKITGKKIYYMHLNKILVQDGEEVQKGQLIALSGKTGASAGYHLHIGVKNGNHWENPMQFINASNSGKDNGDMRLVMHDSEKYHDYEKDLQNHDLHGFSTAESGKDLVTDAGLKQAHEQRLLSYRTAGSDGGTTFTKKEQQHEYKLLKEALHNLSGHGSIQTQLVAQTNELLQQINNGLTVKYSILTIDNKGKIHGGEKGVLQGVV